MVSTLHIAVLSGFLLNPMLVASSPGDWIPEQIQCKYHCEKQYCPVVNPPLDEDVDVSLKPRFFPQRQSISPDFVDKLLHWDCESLCDYQCQQLTTSMLQEQIDQGTEEKLVQFHGKWPFTRVFYIQEFWSVLFSLGNFVPHLLSFFKLNKINKKLDHDNLLINNYRLVAIMGCCAWFFSSVFHFRDLLVTEKLDYFFAGGTVLSGFYAISMRVFLGADREKHKKYGLIGFFFCVLVFSMHVLRLYIDWSYTYNMRFNICFGILQYIMLITLGVQNYIRYRGNKYLNVFKISFTPIFLVFFTGLSMSFEMFDIFISSWQLDSHAIWHGLTIWPTFKLYEFFIEDFKALMSSSRGESDRKDLSKRNL